jgi:hypothetical protein
MFEFISGDAWQYLLILAAVGVLLGLKALTLRTNYNKQLEQFVDPSIFMEEIKKKVKSVEEAEKILCINLSSAIDHQRLRNISILVTLINDQHSTSKCAKNLKNKLAGLQNLTDASKKYVSYILKATQDWD